MQPSSLTAFFSRTFRYSCTYRRSPIFRVQAPIRFFADRAGVPFVNSEHLLSCDIADAKQIKRCTDDIVSEFGRLDVLFNVAGINFRHAAETFPEDKLDQVLGVNVRGNFLMASASGRVMIEQKQGKVINVASLHTHLSLAGMTPYGASKGAIGSMTRALAVEWAAHNIQVNAIAPGFIRTDLNKVLWQDP